MPAARALTPGEIALARAVFGDAIDYARARVAHRKWAFFQPPGVIMAPRGTIHFHPRGGLYRADFGEAPLWLQALFVHELVHVWQHQRGIFLPLRRHPFCRYGYALKPGQDFRRYGLEQQAEIVRHAFMLRHGLHVPGAPPLAQYDSLIPFGGTPA
jgi:hypothetical protein